MRLKEALTRQKNTCNHWVDDPHASSRGEHSVGTELLRKDQIQVRRRTMYCIQIYLQCSDEHTEVFPDDPETTELLVENIVSQALLELFEAVYVEEVVVGFSPNAKESGVR